MSRVRFLGATEDQIRWGSNDDPNEVLTVDSIYEVESEEVHSWHTKITLVEFPGKFNLASFEVVE